MEVAVLHRSVGEQLLPQRPDDTADGGDITSSSSSSNSSSYENNGYKSTEQEVDDNGISEKSVYFDKNDGTTIQWSVSGENLRAEDVDIPKLVNAVINNQNRGNLIKDEILPASYTPKSREEEYIGTRIGENENVRIDVVEESDDEVIELEFKRSVEKVHTHTPYCPNCSSQITKVILRRKKRDKSVHSLVDSHRPEKPVDLFGCLSCFSILIPSGNGLNIFRIFGAKGKQENQQTVKGKQTLSAEFPASLEGSTNTNETATLKQGNAFDLFGIFRRRPENEVAKDSKDDNNAINKPGPFPKVGHYPEIAQPIESESEPDEAVRINIGDGTDGGTEGVTAPGKRESEIRENQNPQSQPRPGTEQRGETDVDAGEQAIISTIHGSKSLEILKCIVYGGLIESITSLSVVSSAAASDATTLNIFALGLATVIGGLLVFGQNLVDLRNGNSGGNSNQQTDRYQELLGKRGHFLLHATFAILSFLLFGLIPPVVYGFTFRAGDNKDYKILAVAAASLTCILVLAIAKAYVRKEKMSEYVKTILYYVTTAISVSGVSYAAGHLIKMLLEKLGWFEPNSAATSFVSGMISDNPTWAASY